MKLFWNKSEQSGQIPASANAQVGKRLPEIKQGNPRKVARRPTCWGGSRALGDAEVVSPASPPADTIKATGGKQPLDQVIHLSMYVAVVVAQCWLHRRYRVQAVLVPAQLSDSPKQGIFDAFKSSPKTSDLDSSETKAQCQAPTAKPSSPSWSPFAKGKTVPAAAAGFTAMQQVYAPPCCSAVHVLR